MKRRIFLSAVSISTFCFLCLAGLLIYSRHTNDSIYYGGHGFFVAISAQEGDLYCLAAMKSPAKRPLTWVRSRPFDFKAADGMPGTAQPLPVVESGFAVQWAGIWCRWGPALLTGHNREFLTPLITVYRMKTPIAWLFLPTLILSIIWLGQTTRRNRRTTANGVCEKCGYDLRATPDRCPECGFIPCRRTVISA